MIPSQRKALDTTPSDALQDKLETIKASIRSKVEHPFKVIQCQFGHRKAGYYRGLTKSTNQLLGMFALSNLSAFGIPKPMKPATLMAPHHQRKPKDRKQSRQARRKHLIRRGQF